MDTGAKRGSWLTRGLLLLGLMLGAGAQTARAADPVQFDPDGAGGANAAQSIGLFDWAVSSNLITAAPADAAPALPLAPGQTRSVQVLNHGALINLGDTSGNPLATPAGLNSSFELTYVAGFGVQVTNDGLGHLLYGGVDTSAKFKNFFEIWYDPNVGLKSNALSGKGYADGATLILRAEIVTGSGSVSMTSPTVAFDQFGTNDYPGQLTVSGNGSQQVVARVTFADPNFFVANSLPVGSTLNFNNSLSVPFLQVNPSGSFVIGSVDDGHPLKSPSLGSVNGQSGPDFEHQIDPNSSFSVNPCSGQIGDFVWFDQNGNGVQDAGEPGIANVKLVLRDSATNALIATATTDQNGLYHFTGLCAGGYSVTVDTTSLPAGYTATLTGAGTAATDSNPSPATVNLAANNSTDFTIDFGFVLPPGVNIVKSTNGEDADLPPGPTIPVGAAVNWTYVVTNTGPVPLINVAVTDDRGVAVSCPKTTLAAGESMTCNASGTATAGQYANVGTVNAQQEGTGTPVTASNPSHYFGAQAAIGIQKTPHDQAIASGATAAWTITVTNTGNVTLSNVTVADVIAPDCVRSAAQIPDLASMAPGTSVTYTCALANVTADLTNTAVATGTPPSGPDVTAQDKARVTVSAPAAITIAKLPDTQTLVSGGTATWTITVTNSGGVTLADVTVTDALAPNCARTAAQLPALASMAPGATATYTCTLADVTADFTNVAQAKGTPPAGPDVTASASAAVHVVHPHIVLRKTTNGQDAPVAPGPSIAVGGTVTWSYIVTNDGDVALQNVVVTDDRQGAICTLATLAVNEVQTCTKLGTAAAGQYANIGSVTGSDVNGNPVNASYPSHYFGVNAHIAITKTPKTQTVLSGSTVTFNIVVTNDGNVDLTNVTVTDPIAPDCAKSLGTLAAGASQNYSCTLANVTADLTNTATATGTPPAGPNVSATDTAQVTVIHPAIAIVKAPKTQTVPGGSAATFTITVTNTGDVDLANVTVTDPLAPNCAKTLGTLAPGASQTYTCTLANVTADFTNTATAAGTPPIGPDVTATDTAQVKVSNAGITIVKSPKTQQVVSGATATFTITVTNTGNVDLTNVTVADVLAPNCARNLGTLAPGATQTYTCTLANVTADLTNVATVTGTPPVGPPVTGSDTAQVTVTRPAITITKTPKTQQVVSGSTVTFTITVTNTGDVTLSNVTVADPAAPNCAKAIGTLAPGATQTYTCTLANVTANLTNVATVTGHPPAGPDVTANDSAQVTLVHPAIGITKTPKTQQVTSGSAATFTITVTNTGDVTLSNVTVTDPIAANCAKVIGTLAPGATQTYTCTLANVTANLTNVATVTGHPPVGPDVTASDNAQVTVVAAVAPAIKVTKYVSVDGGKTWDDANTPPGPTVNLPSGCGGSSVGTAAPGGVGGVSLSTMGATGGGKTSGGKTSGGYGGTTSGGTTTGGTTTGGTTSGGTTCPTVMFKFVILNIGNVPLSNVTLSDNLYSTASCAGLPATLGTSAPGNAFTCIIAQLATAGQHTDTATASGSFNSITVNAQDDANYFGAAATGAPVIKVTKYVSVDGGKTWDDANAAPGPSVTLPSGCGGSGGSTTSGGTKTSGGYGGSTLTAMGGTGGGTTTGGKTGGTTSGGTSGGTTCPTVMFKFVIQNVGNVTLTNVTLSDNLYSTASCAGLPATLGTSAPGNSITCIIAQTATAGQHTDTATATGHFNTQTVTAQDNANYFGAGQATGGGQGCTPGYWKQPQHFGSWTSPYTPNTSFSAVFDNAFPGKTLLQVLSAGGGGLIALGRHTVAAMLNGASPHVASGMTAQGVISAFDAAYPGSAADYQSLQTRFANLNEQSCPLGLDPGSP